MNFKDSLKILLLLLILSTTLSSCLNGYFIPSLQRNYAKQFTPFDAVIVPGYPYDPQKVWNNTIQTRVLWSVYLYQQGKTKNIIYSGSSVYSPYIESEIMRLYALQLGVPDSVIFVEKEAEHGVENLYFSYVMAKDLGFKNIALATDAAQLLQLGYFGRPFADYVTLMPADMSLIQVPYPDSIVIDPSNSIDPNFILYTEEIGPLERFIRSSGRGGLRLLMRKYIKAEHKINKGVKG